MGTRLSPATTSFASDSSDPPAPEVRPRAILVDVDGTVAEKHDRHPYDMSTVHQDTPITPITYLVDLLHYTGYQIVFVSGRFEHARHNTETWLDQHLVSPMRVHDLFLRPDEDYRPDYEIKDEIYRCDVEPHWDVHYVLDDRDQVVSMWRHTHGLTVLQVAEGNF